jgi:predicted NBD/HSP70 family sugar kinase
VARLRTGSKALIRDLNRSAILALIGGRGPISRVEIARQLSLSGGTVTVLTRELVDDGLIQELDKEPSNGGRRAVRLALVGTAAHAIGVKIAPDHMTAVRVNLDGEPTEFWEQPFDAAAPDAVTTLGDLLEVLIRRWGDAPARLLGIGLGVPGIADGRAGVVESPLVGWRSLPLGALLEERLGLPVLIDNDVNTLAVAERLYGRGRNVEHFLTITLGRGVGLGIVVAGELYRGARGGAGEFGHVRVMDGGPVCHCGKHGCLEAVVADDALVAGARDAELIGPEDGAQRLLALADAGDPAALLLYAQAGATFGRAVAGLVNVFSPQLVLISGEGTLAWQHLHEAFDGALRPDIFEPLREVAVEVDPWDDAKWARGAAALVLRATFAAPLYERHADDLIRARLVEAPARAVA